MKLFAQNPKPVSAFKYTRQLHSELASLFERFGKGFKQDGSMKVFIRNQDIGEVEMYDKFIAIQTGVYFNTKDGITISTPDFSSQIKVESGKWVVFNQQIRMVLTDEYFSENYYVFK